MDFVEIILRAKNILITPGEEWKLIKEEQKTRSGLIREYALPFILLLSLATLLGMVLFRNYVTAGIMVVNALITFFGAFISIYISTYIINSMAKNFESKKDFNSSFQLVVYSYTALFVAHTIGSLILPLFFVTIFGIYSAYLLWTGLGIIMETPADKKVVYGLVSSITVLGVYVVMNILLSAIYTKLLVSYGMNSLT
jgi:hypothetical protein